MRLYPDSDGLREGEDQPRDPAGAPDKNGDGKGDGGQFASKGGGLSSKYAALVPDPETKQASGFRTLNVLAKHQKDAGAPAHAGPHYWGEVLNAVSALSASVNRGVADFKRLRAAYAKSDDPAVHTEFLRFILTHIAPEVAAAGYPEFGGSKFGDWQKAVDDRLFRMK